MKKISHRLTAHLLIASVLIWSVAHAAEKVEDEQKNPLGCQDVGYQYDLKTLTLTPNAGGSKQTMYFFYNKSGKAVSLYQMRNPDSSSHSLRLNHTLSPKLWAVMSLIEPEAKFICAVDNPKYPEGEVVDCSEHVKVCEFTKVIYGLNNRGNFWMVEANSRNGALRDVVRYGVIPAY